MITEVFEAKSRAELVELALQSGASIAGESRGLRQEGTSKASATRKLNVILNYMLDFSNYAASINVLSNACIA